MVEYRQLLWGTQVTIILLFLLYRGQVAVQQAGVGSVVSIAPGERHWHGATSDAPATHVALNVDATTDWLEKVTDAQYAD